MAENNYYIPQTAEEINLREGLNGSDIGGHDSGRVNSRPGFTDKID
jgi:hypothetical protein